MIRPVRLQRRRTKGFNLQAESRAFNGLTAIDCTRPGPFGNSFIVGTHGTASECVDLYRNELNGRWPNFYRTALANLPGHNLVCWCGLYDPCHVDVLLDIFGRIECSEVAA